MREATYSDHPSGQYFVPGQINTVEVGRSLWLCVHSEIRREDHEGEYDRAIERRGRMDFEFGEPGPMPEEPPRHYEPTVLDLTRVMVYGMYRDHQLGTCRLLCRVIGTGSTLAYYLDVPFVDAFEFFVALAESNPEVTGFLTGYEL